MNMIRKLTALMLALVVILSFSCTATVGALNPSKSSTSSTTTRSSAKKAQSTATVLLSESMDAQTMVNVYNRTATAAMLVLDYCLLFDGDSQEILFDSTAFICARTDTAIDIFIPMIDGDYENLYFMTSGQIIDYGRRPETDFANQTKYQFHAVAGSSILRFLQKMSKSK